MRSAIVGDSLPVQQTGSHLQVSWISLALLKLAAPVMYCIHDAAGFWGDRHKEQRQSAEENYAQYIAHIFNSHPL